MLEFTQRLEWINEQGINAVFLKDQLHPYIGIMEQLPKLAMEHKQHLSITILSQGINTELANASLDQLSYLSSLLSAPFHLGDTASRGNGLTEGEKNEIRATLLGFHRNIRDEFHLKENIDSEIKEKLDNIRSALDTMNRDQWEQLAFSTFISIATGLLINAVNPLPIFAIITSLLPSAAPMLTNKS